jgi:hypothetical protein
MPVQYLVWVSVPRDREETLKGTASKPTFFVLATLASAAILALVGFGLGWFLSGWQVASLREEPGSPRVVTTTVTRPSTDLPESDVRGKDFSDLPRYPDSRRVEYQRRASAGLVLVDTEHVAPAKLDDVREFYRDIFRTEKWSVAGLDVSEDEWDFFVNKGEREAVIESESRGELVEIEIEVSEPRKGGEASGKTPSSRESERPETTAAPSGPGDFGDDYDDDYDDDLEDDYDDLEDD